MKLIEILSTPFTCSIVLCFMLLEFSVKIYPHLLFKVFLYLLPISGIGLFLAYPIKMFCLRKYKTVI